jgi:hypothetical protein
MSTIYQFTNRAFDLGEDERSFLVHCIRTAAAKFNEDAIECGHGSGLAVQFERQDQQAGELAARIESAESVRLGREVPD